MSTSPSLVLRNSEIVELLGDEPELLAIADAYESTQRRYWETSGPARFDSGGDLLERRSLRLSQSPQPHSQGRSEVSLGFTTTEPRCQPPRFPIRGSLRSYEIPDSGTVRFAK